jgi:hypothetical protein
MVAKWLKFATFALPTMAGVLFFAEKCRKSKARKAANLLLLYFYQDKRTFQRTDLDPFLGPCLPF